MKTSRAPVQSPRISASVRLTCLPGRLPRTSKSLAMTSSTSVGPDVAVEEDAIHPRSERRPPAARAEAAQVRLAAQQGISEAAEGCSDLLHGSWRPPGPKLTQHGSGATQAITQALRGAAETRRENRRPLRSRWRLWCACLSSARSASPSRRRASAAAATTARSPREAPHDARGRPPSYPLRLWRARPSPPCFQA